MSTNSATAARVDPTIDTIARHGVVSGIEGIPNISQVVVHGGVAHVCGVTPDPTGDMTAQTLQTLDRVDALLARVGTDKHQLLTAQVWLSDMRLFAEHNAAWNTWVDAENSPARACVEARLWLPGMLVEVMVTAAVPDFPRS